MPRIDSFPRLMRIPFILRLALQTRRVTDTSNAEPPGDAVAPSPQLEKASLHLRLKIRSCARGGVQYHMKMFDENATDNFLHGITTREESWTLKQRDMTACWEKGYIWSGLWTIREAPSFANRQLTWTVRKSAAIVSITCADS